MNSISLLAKYSAHLYALITQIAIFIIFISPSHNFIDVLLN